MAKLNIVGVGPGSPDYVTLAARKTVREAEVVIGAQRSLNLFTEDIKGETMILTAKNLNSALKFAVESAEKGKKVALLSTGDPGFSGLLRTVLKSNLVKAVEINVIPGVSSIQACAARLGISWDDACLFTFHEGDVSIEEKNELVSCLKNLKDAMLLPDSRAFPPREIASFLIKAGVDKETPVFVCENLTLDDERVISSSLEEVSKQTFGSLCVMVIKANRKVKG
ncbi:precorrin-6y C5,15-methyltransferase (decarboxylating) subunit CbiE [Candidatus Bathyarchaeota archaeon]|nr:precorrin-6y C5,15-methyltransferase (decarboxylating) subunit CbiE [Candidatus Bathyarchaeota archaeon]